MRLLLSMSGSRKLLFAAIAGATVNTAIILANAFLVAAVIVGIIYRHPSVILHIGQLISLWIFRAIFTSQYDRWSALAAAKFKAELREQILTSKEILVSTSATRLSTLLIKGANSLDIYLGRFLPNLFNAVLTPIAVIVAIACLDFTSAIIAIVTLPIIPVFGALIGRYTSDAVTEKWQSLGTLARYFEDSLRGIHTLAIFGRHRSQSARIREMGDKYTAETMKVLRISFLSALVLELAATISVALIAVSIGVRLVSSSMEFLPALTILILAPEVYFPLRNAASLFHASADGGAALSELTEIQSENRPPTSTGAISITEIHSLSWHSWRSPYGSGVIPAASLSSGEKLVIRGGSGLGKTTFLNSILGIHGASEIFINGIEIASVELKSFHRQVGWIPQNPTLITGTVRELFVNLAHRLNDQEITAILSRVGLDLNALPHGLDTPVSGIGEKSGEVSGGQKRRLAIARALAINPTLIIADEVTADLDPTSASEILRVLEECAENGAIVIAVLHAPDQKISGAHEWVMTES